MEFDYSKLKGLITEKYGSQRDFAKALKRDDTYVSRYLTGNARFTQAVIALWVEALDIAITDIGLYFFTPKVDN